MTFVSTLERRVLPGALSAMLLLLPFSKAAVEIIFGLLCIGWLCQLSLAAGWRQSVWMTRAARWVGIALVLYAVACLLSVPTSAHVAKSLRGFISKTAEYLLFFIIAAEITYRRPTRAMLGMWPIIVAVVLVCADGLVQMFTGFDLVRRFPFENFGRMTGPYENPNDLATYLIFVIPLIGAFMMTVQRVRRWFVGAVLVFVLWATVMTTSQGAWLGLGAALVVLAWHHRQWRLWIVLGTIILAIGGYSMVQSIGDNLHPGLQDRLYMWEAGWRMWLDRPWIGHGLNTFMSQYLDYWVGGEFQPRYAHNCYLQVLAETGLIGLITFIGLLGSMIIIALRAIHRATIYESRTMLIGMLASVVAFLVQASIDTNFYSLRHAALFWVLSGMMVGYAWSVQRHVTETTLTGRG